MANEVVVVAGTRPELIKLAPVFKWLEVRGVDYVFVWSGQHYDYELSRVFIEELNIPEPQYDLGVGSGSHSVQTAKAMMGLEKVLDERKPRAVVAVGDTNTVVASALASSKKNIPFLHIESGLRSWDKTMPEELNRIVADHLGFMLFAPSKLAYINLLAEGIPSNRIVLSGNTVVDVLLENVGLAREISDRVLSSIGVEEREYILVTVHRQENTDNPRRLIGIFNALNRLVEDYGYKVVVPLHPRTRNRLIEYGLMDTVKEKLTITRPLGYLEFIALMEKCLVVLTDSGGVQEEAYTLRVPIVTLRYNTERIETVLYGLNVLAGADTNRIVEYTIKMIEYRDKIVGNVKGKPNPYGDGRAGERIASWIKDNLDELTISDVDLTDEPIVSYKLVREVVENHKLLDKLIGFNADGVPVLENPMELVVRVSLRWPKPWENLDS